MNTQDNHYIVRYGQHNIKVTSTTMSVKWLLVKRVQRLYPFNAMSWYRCKYLY